MALKAWLIEQEPGLAERSSWIWTRTPAPARGAGRQALQQANTRCEAVICLLSKHWEASRECQTEFRYAENLNKTILVARLEPAPDTNITSEWQRCDLFPDQGATTEVEIADAGEPVVLDTVGLQRLLEALRALGIGAEHFPWPPPGDPDRAPYRGWAPLEDVDAAVFFGRDAQILRGQGCAAWHAHLGGAVPVRDPGAVGGRESRRFCARACCPGCAATTTDSCRCPSCAPNARCSPANTGSRTRSAGCAPIWACRSRCRGRSRPPANPTRWSGCGAGCRRPGRQRATGCSMCPPMSRRRPLFDETRRVGGPRRP